MCFLVLLSLSHLLLFLPWTTVNLCICGCNQRWQQPLKPASRIQKHLWVGNSRPVNCTAQCEVPKFLYRSQSTSHFPLMFQLIEMLALIWISVICTFSMKLPAYPKRLNVTLKRPLKDCLLMFAIITTDLSICFEGGTVYSIMCSHGK